MHKEGEYDIDISHLSKIEGHADLEVKIKDGKVEFAHLKISESKRFFTQGVRGKHCLSVAQLVSRICGTCSIAHLLCCIEAVENALQVSVSQQTKVLKTLTMDGLMIRDHAMHLYIFCLPDIFGADSVLELAEKNKSLIEKALEVKSAGNELSKAVAGRSVHAIFPAVGGYTKIISNQQAKEILHQLEHAREHALEFVDLFKDNLPLFERKTHFVALKNEKYEYIGGEICSSEGYCIPPQNFWDYLNRVVVPYSQATAFEFAGREYMVGALARMNLNKESLHKNTKKDCASAISMFPSNNIYMNNLAQAIEIVHSLDRSIEILESFEFKEEKYAAPLVRAGAGIGVLEAPRGTLYYALKINDAGLIEYINLVIPTAQNHQNMEKDIAAVVQKKLDENLPKEAISLEAEKIIRAYDPCMSCATHFLKLKIKEDKITNKSRKTKKPINPWTFKAEGKL